MNNENKLEEWEIICPDCNGETKKEYKYEREIMEFNIGDNIMRIPGPIIDETNGFCFRCMGTGKITWIDKIMGKGNGKM